jgi:pimeloyl-ACP methyl ester carboxylesterase
LATLHVAEAGPPAGPPVLLLHGFPEFWWGWRRQIGPLAAAGFRVIAPDLRGYNQSDKPTDLDSYRLDRLGSDVVALADALGHERVHLAGHDWGGIVACWVAARHPERVIRLAILNAPHPDAVWPTIRRDPVQLLRSFYVGLFQPPAIPEAFLRANDYAALARALTATSRPGTFGEGELDRYRESWRQPGALTAMLNWYRALVRRRPERTGRVRAPTLVLWGVRDHALGPTVASESVKFCDRGRVQRFETATHWLQHEEPEAVNAALLAFLNG